MPDMEIEIAGFNDGGDTCAAVLKHGPSRLDGVGRSADHLLLEGLVAVALIEDDESACFHR
jgi:hypothetical protein